MAIVDELSALRTSTLAAIEQAADTSALEEVRVAVLGKAGTLTGYLRGMGEAQNLTHEQTLNMIQWIGGIPFLVGALGGILTSVWSDSMIKRGRSSVRRCLMSAPARRSRSHGVWGWSWRFSASWR